MRSEIFLISGLDIISENRNRFAPSFANRLRPKADFGVSRGYAGRSRHVEFVTAFSPHGEERVFARLEP
jgi:hypothetical protein